MRQKETKNDQKWTKLNKNEYKIAINEDSDLKIVKFQKLQKSSKLKNLIIFKPSRVKMDKNGDKKSKFVKILYCKKT